MTLTNSPLALSGWRAALAAAALLTGCGPPHSVVAGEYQLEGDPQRPTLVWQLARDGTFTAKDGEKATHGAWRYGKGARGGTLTVTTEFVTHDYQVVGIGDTVEIVVDPDKDIVFRKATRASGAAER